MNASNRSNRTTRRRLIYAALAGSVFSGLSAPVAYSALTLTQQGVDAHFALSTFASGFSNSSSVGPLGIAFTDSGGVMVVDFPGNLRIFPTDTDGQSVSGTPAVANYGLASLGGITQDGSTIYSTNKNAGTVVELSQSGTIAKTFVTTFSLPLGIVYNPHNGHLIVAAAGGNTIRDFDPVADVKTTIASPSSPDGLALSADGGTIYAATNNQVLGFNTSTGQQVFSSGTISTVDGTAIGTGAFAGYLFANCNNGFVYQVPLAGGTPIPIASGGSRGDFVTVDPHNGSILLTQTDSIIRLTGPSVSVTHPILSLAPAGTTLYGTQVTNGTGTTQGLFTNGLNALTVTGGHGSYTAAQVTGINNGSGLATAYVAVTGFNPGTESETFGLDVLIGGRQATLGQIGTLIADITSNHSYGFTSTSVSVAVSAIDPVPRAFESLTPNTPYNLFFTITGLTTPVPDFGFDFSQDPTYGAGGTGGTATVVAVAVVPEPAAVTAALAWTALASRPRRKSRAA